jgi:hypothetical protein
MYVCVCVCVCVCVTHTHTHDVEATKLQSLWRTQKTTGRPTRSPKLLRPSLKSKIGTPIRRSTAIHLFLFSWSSAKQEMSSYSWSPLRVAIMNMSVRPRWSPTASSSIGTATTVPLDVPDDSAMLSESTSFCTEHSARMPLLWLGDALIVSRPRASRWAGQARCDVKCLTEPPTMMELWLPRRGARASLWASGDLWTRSGVPRAGGTSPRDS